MNKNVTDKRYTLKMWIWLIQISVSAEKVPVDDNYYYYSPLYKKNVKDGK